MYYAFWWWVRNRKEMVVGWLVSSEARAWLFWSSGGEEERSSSSRMHADRLFLFLFWGGGLEACMGRSGCSGYLFPLFFAPPPFSRSPSRFFLFRTYGRLPFSFCCFHLCHPSLLSLPCSRFHFSLSLHFLSSSI